MDFNGGVFHFQDGNPTTFLPKSGDVLIYTADTRNVHSVEEITDGERLTLTLWFTRDKSHDEDSKLISSLTKLPFNYSDTCSKPPLPFPASQNMYWFPPEQSSTYETGFDVRCARLHVLGYQICCKDARVESSFDFSDILLEPLHVVRGNELFAKEFSNILHLLQVVQFYYWKCHELKRTGFEMEPMNVGPVSVSQREIIRLLKVEFLKDEDLAKSIFQRGTYGGSVEHDWVGLCGAVDSWEEYTSNLWHDLVLRLPNWIENQSIFYETDGGSCNLVL